jgi:hypothetical protein
MPSSDLPPAPTLYELRTTPLPICVDIIDDRWGYDQHTKLHTEMTLEEAQRWCPGLTPGRWLLIWYWTIPMHAGDPPTYYTVTIRLVPDA